MSAQLSTFALCVLTGCSVPVTNFEGATDGASTGDSGEPAATNCGPESMSPCDESLLVPGGSFLRFFDVHPTDASFGNPNFEATVSPFQLDKYEVTVGRFRQFVTDGKGTQQDPPAEGAGGRLLNGQLGQGGWEPAWNLELALDTPLLKDVVKCNSTRQTWTDEPGENENRPINCVTWYDAMAFCIWDGGFLPTVTEVNFAASAGDQHRVYPWSDPATDSTITSTHASYGIEDEIIPVGTRPAGNGFWGHSDLGGNVLEWLLDTTASTVMTCNDCASLTDNGVRSWRSGYYGGQELLLRAAYHNGHSPKIRSHDHGFRCGRP